MRIILALAVALLAPITALSAEGDWFETQGAKLRLIALPAADGKTFDAGLQIELEPGWKTYWKAPGASGLPPKMDFSGSRNVASTSVAFPLPTTFGDGKGITAGYKSSVTLPITVEPLFEGRPTTLRAKGFLGVCEDICVPVPFDVSVALSGSTQSSRAVASALLTGRAAVPGAATDTFRITAAKADGDRVVIEAVVPRSATSATLFPAGPADWYLGPVKASAIGNGRAKFSLPMDQRPPDAAVAGTEVEFTLRAGDQGIVQDVALSD